MDTKVCNKCGKEKNINEFGKLKNTKDGYTYYCKECNNKLQQKWRYDNRLKSYLKIKTINKITKTFNIIGCDSEFLKKYIENQFTDGMTWENYGTKGWHVDHRIPLDSDKTEDDVFNLCHYTNLQPLWRKDNLKKSNKIEWII